MNGRIYRFGDFELDSANRQFRRGGKLVQLPPKAFDLLQTLVENNGRLVGKDEIFDRVWKDQIVEESNLTVHMSAIRKALGETKSKPRFITTVPGYGYHFKADNLDDGDEELVIETQSHSRITIENVEERSDAVQAIDSSPRSLGEETIATTGKRRPLLVAAALGLAGVSVVGLWFWNQIPENRGASVPLVSAEKQPRIKRLTTNGRVNLAVISPDGNFIAYSVYEKGSNRIELRLGQTNGSSDVVLLPKGSNETVSNPIAFSADGDWVYYVQNKPRDNDNGTLYKIPVLGGVPQKLIESVSVYSAISPDEKQIAFVRSSRDQKTSSIIVANLDGTNETAIASRPLSQAIRGLSITWSPDSSLIAFGAAAKKEDKREIFTVRVADGNVQQLTSLDWNHVAKLAWLGDGTGILAVAQQGKDKMMANQLWQVDYPSGSARKINSDLSNYGSALSISKSQAFVTVQVNEESNIWIAPAENLDKANQVTFGALGRQDGWFGLDWTPDGRIVYTARIDQSLTIWIMNRDGSNATQLTPVGFQDRHLSVSGDGTFVAFQSNRSGTNEIWRVDIDGSNLSQLTKGDWNTNPGVSPDGKWIVYQHTAGGENSIWRIPAAGGEAVRLIDKDSHSPRVSPDGQSVACGYFAEGRMKIAVIPMEGNGPTKVFDVPSSYNFDMGTIRWSPDGRSINYRDWYNGVWQQPLSGGPFRRLDGLPDEKLFQYDWSRDGKLFAFTRGRSVRDVVLITDFR